MDAPLLIAHVVMYLPADDDEMALAHCTPMLPEAAIMRDRQACGCLKGNMGTPAARTMVHLQLLASRAPDRHLEMLVSDKGGLSSLDGLLRGLMSATPDHTAQWQQKAGHGMYDVRRTCPARSICQWQCHATSERKETKRFSGVQGSLGSWRIAVKGAPRTTYLDPLSAALAADVYLRAQPDCLLHNFLPASHLWLSVRSLSGLIYLGPDLEQTAPERSMGGFQATGHSRSGQPSNKRASGQGQMEQKRPGSTEV